MRLEELALRRHEAHLGLGRHRAGPARRGRSSTATSTRTSCVIGGGIVGITTALLLPGRGRAHVVLLEANRLACGVSGFTTAKVSSQHGLIYARLRSRFGRDGAARLRRRQPGGARVDGRAGRARRDRLRLAPPALLRLRHRADRAKAEQEAEAAIEAGLPASLVEETALPYDVAAAVRFERPGRVPRPQVPARARRRRLTEVYERSHAVEVDVDGRCVVKTPGGRVTADRVVVATHYPFLDRALAFPRVHPQRSYALALPHRRRAAARACTSPATPPPARSAPCRSAARRSCWSAARATTPARAATPRSATPRSRRFAREHWAVRSVDYRWSSQDNTTIDTVPYVGRMTPVRATSC